MDDVYPSDAHLTAEQRESVFGTALKKRTLNGVTVHYAYLRAAFLNDFHQERITRFWSLFIPPAARGPGHLCARHQPRLPTCAREHPAALRGRSAGRQRHQDPNVGGRAPPDPGLVRSHQRHPDGCSSPGVPPVTGQRAGRRTTPTGAASTPDQRATGAIGGHTTAARPACSTAGHCRASVPHQTNR